MEVILGVAAIQPLVAELVGLSQESQGPEVRLWALAACFSQRMEALGLMYAPSNPACGGQLLMQLLDLRQPGCASPLSFTPAGTLTYVANGTPHQVRPGVLDLLHVELCPASLLMQKQLIVSRAILVAG